MSQPVACNKKVLLVSYLDSGLLSFFLCVALPTLEEGRVLQHALYVWGKLLSKS